VQALPVSAALWMVLAAGIPLTPQQHERLSITVDGPDQRDDAFAALVENIRRWTGEPSDEPIRLSPDFKALLERPAEFRGDLCRIAGRIQQRAQLPPPFEMMTEWFIRIETGLPVIVYVAGLEPGTGFDEGRLIEIDARFFKRIDLTARDGKVHGYPAFVGAFPRLIAKAAAPQPQPIGPRRLWLIAGPVVAMLIVFAALFLYVRRQQKRRAPHRWWRRTRDLEPTAEPVDGGASLPDDPAEALAELKRRAEPPSADADDHR